MPNRNPPSGASRSVSLLKEARFRRLWLTGGLGWTVRWLEILSVALYALEASGSAFVVASMMFARMLPTVLLGGVAGVIAERFERRNLLALGLAGMCLNAAVLCALGFAGVLSIWHIAAGAGLSGVFWCMEYSVRRTLVADVAGLERMGNAAAIDSATLHLTRLVGPLAGGVLFGALGLTGVYLLSTALYAVALVNVATLERGARRPVAAGRSWLHSLLEGFAQVRSHRIIAGTLAVTVIMNFFGFPFVSMIPVIGEGRLHLGPAAIGVLMSMDGFGALVGASLIAVVVRPALYIRIYAGGAALLLAALPVFALSVYFPLSLGSMFVAGLGMSGFAAMQSTILLSHTPSDKRPLLMGVLTLCIGAGPVGLLHLGLLAEWLGAPRAVAIIAIEGLVALALAVFVWPELRGAHSAPSSTSSAASPSGRRARVHHQAERDRR